MPARVEQIDHTADVGLRVVGATPADTFAALAEGMVDFMVDRAGIEPAERRTVAVRGDGWEDLLVRWLEEILYLYESEGFVPQSVRVVDIDPDRIQGELLGAPLDPAHHELGIQIKAVTYHGLLAQETPEGFGAQVIFDI